MPVLGRLTPKGAPPLVSNVVILGSASANYIDPSDISTISISGNRFILPRINVGGVIIPSASTTYFGTTSASASTGVNFLPSGSYVNVTVTNINGKSTIYPINLAVNNRPSLSSSTFAGTAGSANNVNVNSAASDRENNTPYTYTLVSGSFPPSVSINSSGVITGTWIPTGINNPSVVYNPVIRITDSLGFSRTVTLTFNVNVPFFWQQVITTGYVLGGYKDSSPWRNVNRTVHATDTTTNLGDLIQYATAYSSGAHNATFAWLFAGGGMNDFAFNNISRFNMRTETQSNTTTSVTTVYNDLGTAIKQFDYSLSFGGGSDRVTRFNFSNETSVDLGTQSAISSSGTGASCIMDQDTSAWGWSDSNRGRVVFSTNTFTNRDSVGFGWHGQQKGTSSKLGKGYMGNEGSYNGGNNHRVCVFATETYTTVTKPITNSGEENLDMGQDVSFMMGMYDGLQNNRAWKLNYSTNTGSELGSGGQPKGTPGRSSGHSYWRD